MTSPAPDAASSAAAPPAPPDDEHRQAEPASTSQQPPQPQQPSHSPPNPPPFAPIYTLVTNSTTRTTHHPRVHYIFADDDPDLLTQALADSSASRDSLQRSTGASDIGTGAEGNRAVILDVIPDEKASSGYSVAWASSLAASWAVVDTQLSLISPPSSESEVGARGVGAGDVSAADGGEDGGDGAADASSALRDTNSGDAVAKRPDRLMLRIEGVENMESSTALGSAGELRAEVETGRQHDSGSADSSSSGRRGKDREAEPEDYTALVDDFEKRMGVLRKVVDAGEERRRRIEGHGASQDESRIHQETEDDAGD